MKLPPLWESGNQVLRLWNNVQKAFGGRSCTECHSRDVDVHIVNSFNKPTVVIACWNCGGANPVARIKGV